MEHFIYYPTTQYHLIITFVLREQNNKHYNSIILDEAYFSNSFINKVANSSNWDKVYIVKLLPRMSDFINRNIFFNLNYKEIFNIEHSNLVIFTFGNTFTNLLVNSIYKKNNIFMGEDGIFPYYGLDVVKEYPNMLKNEHYIRKLKRFVFYKINDKNCFDIQKINKFLIINPEWLPQEFTQQCDTARIMLDQKRTHKIFDELTYLYEYKKENSLNDIDIIYFDSNLSIEGFITEQAEYEILCKLFNIFQKMKIVIKLKPNHNELINTQRINFYIALQKDTGCKFVINVSSAKYPWEIIYYNNRADLKNVIFMSSIFSTAFITPKKFFRIENNIICLQNFFIKVMKNYNISKSIDDLTTRIKRSFFSKNIYMPKTYYELEKIANSVSKNMESTYQ